MTAREIRRNYYTLLRDWRWVELSQRLIDERGKCAECGAEGELQCHHKGYRDGFLPWDYPESEIAVVCKSCHESITANADDLWNEALRHLNQWQIYELAKTIRQGDLKHQRKVEESFETETI